MSVEPMKQVETSGEGSLVVAFRSLGGALVQVYRHTPVVRSGLRNEYSWRCEGCGDPRFPFEQHSEYSAMHAATEHAGTCRAVPLRTRIIGESELGEIRAGLAELTETVRDLVVLTGRAVELAASRDAASRRRAWWRRGGGR